MKERASLKAELAESRSTCKKLEMEVEALKTQLNIYEIQLKAETEKKSSVLPQPLPLDLQEFKLEDCYRLQSLQ